jgi:hypothetical protein
VPRHWPSPWTSSAVALRPRGSSSSPQYQRAIEEGDLATAQDGLDRLRTWNSGSEAIPVLAAAIELREGAIGPKGLTSAVDPNRSPSSIQLFAAQALLVSGAHGEADGVLDDLDRYLDERRAWEVSEGVLYAAAVRLQMAYDRGGCPAARGSMVNVSTLLAGYDLLDPDEAVELAGIPCELAS